MSNASTEKQMLQARKRTLETIKKKINENQKERKDNFLTQAIDELPIRYIFIKFKDDSRTKVYKFIGVYELDVKKSINKNIRVWAKKGDEIDLKFFK